jgi:hypothetical protein
MFLLAVPFSVAICQTQGLGQQRQQAPPPVLHEPQTPEDETRDRLEKEAAKRASKERWEQLKRDTDNLLKLSNELKEYMDKANEDTLSLDVIKKAEQIEKLAHNVKEKMKGQ